MSFRRSALAALVVFASFAGACSRAVDVAESSDPKVASPEWVQDGLALARKQTGKKSVTPVVRAELPDTTTTAPAASTYQLPPEAEFTAALASLGLDAASASCVYNGIVGTPLAETVGRMLTTATNPLAAVTDPSAAGASAVDEGTQRQLLVALAPCLDTNMLLTVLSAVSGGTLGGGVNALLTSVMSNLGSLPKVDPAAVARTAGVNLTPAQIAELQKAIAAAQAANAAVANSANIDFSKIDVSKLSREELMALLAAVVKGLTPAQAAQLSSLAAVDLRSLNLDIDASQLTKSEIGTLFVLLLPYISANIAFPTNAPPPGTDPSQIYIPPGTDLSAINPLNFIPRDTLVTGLTQQYGIPAQQAGCLYDRIRLIDPRLIGEAYLGNSEQGSAQLAMAFISCVVSP